MEEQTLLEQVKQKILHRINKVLDNQEGINADTMGYFISGIAKFEENEILKNKEPIHYKKVVEDVNTLIDKLPSTESKVEII